jgi:ParB family chromosome partitioning protein
LGESEIPALVIEASIEDCMIKSLVENCARRHHRAIDLLHDIGGMRSRGYSDSEIAKKTGLSLEYVRGVGRLLVQGEQRLLRAVESGHIPVSVAVEIADADDVGMQVALQQAYEKNLLRGRRLLIVKRIVESRRRRGRRLDTKSKRDTQNLSSRSLVRVYREDTDRKRLLIRKADATRNRLIFIAHAMRELFVDEKFIALLKAEKLDSIPRKLLSRTERGDIA